MSTPTEAHYDLRRHVIFSDPDDGAELIADSEANAVAAAVTALTCIHHNDLERAARPVCLVAALTAERDQLRAELANEKNLHAQTRMVVEELNTICIDLRNAGGPPFIRSEAIRLLREDQATLRAEVERLKKQAVFDADHIHELNAAFATRAEVEEAHAATHHWCARAERAEDELATEREKSERYRLVTLRQDADLTAERARLDYMSTRGFEHRHHGNGDHLAFEWTISSTNELKDVSLRAVIDAAMKEDAK